MGRSNQKMKGLKMRENPEKGENWGWRVMPHCDPGSVGNGRVKTTSQKLLLYF